MVRRSGSAASIGTKGLFSTMISSASWRMTGCRERCRWASTEPPNGLRSAFVTVHKRVRGIAALSIALIFSAGAVIGEVIPIESSMAPPEWAYAERALLKESTKAAIEFARKYTDTRGHFRGVERWGGNDGPDDVMETFNNWPLLYALGAD